MNRILAYLHLPRVSVGVARDNKPPDEQFTFVIVVGVGLSDIEVENPGISPDRLNHTPAEVRAVVLVRENRKVWLQRTGHVDLHCQNLTTCWLPQGHNAKEVA